ncbi:MAG: hemolysin family protein [Planctomycetota bacterium]|nr:hemolysin family protein [Planctomycetota bacterium]MDA1106305.1 hemolysin family protein [Planctomycetota bacterium]
MDDVLLGVQVAAMLALTVLSAFFSASETALFGLDHAQRAALRRSSPAKALVVDALCSDPRSLLATVLLANVLVNTMYFAIGGALAVRMPSAWTVAALGAAQVMWLVTLGEVLPKSTAMILREVVAPRVASPLRSLVVLTAPVRRLLSFVVIEPIDRLVGRPALGTGPLTRADLVEAIAAGEEVGALSTDEELLLRRLMVHRTLRVRDVMTPRTELAWVPSSPTAELVIAAARAWRVRRLVVCREGDLDQVEGLLDVRQFLVAVSRGGGEDLGARPAAFVPELATLGQLDSFFRARKADIAIVVDEFGGTAGIVAVEDSLEQLVGDIASRGESTPAVPTRAADGTVTLDGRTSIADCTEAIECALPAMHASTVAGMVSEMLGRVPRPGDTFVAAGREWHVLAVQQGRASVVSAQSAATGDIADRSGLRGDA